MVTDSEEVTLKRRPEGPEKGSHAKSRRKASVFLKAHAQGPQGEEVEGQLGEGSWAGDEGGGRGRTR